MNHHLALGKTLLMNVGAHAILYLAFSFLLCGFDATNLQETQLAKELDLTCSTTFLFSDASFWQIRFFQIFHFLLMIPTACNNEAPFRFLHTAAGVRVPFIHSLRHYNVLQGGMDVATFFPKA